MTTVDDIAARLGLSPHPEGGFYRETYRHDGGSGERGAVTVIYYLLRDGERSAWHRIDATEIWHHYARARLRLTIAEPGEMHRTVTLGTDFSAGQQAHAVVPAGAWQTAEPEGGWVLTGCTVAPAFLFSGFEMAPPGWQPEGGERTD